MAVLVSARAWSCGAVRACTNVRVPRSSHDPRSLTGVGGSEDADGVEFSGTSVLSRGHQQCCALYLCPAPSAARATAERSSWVAPVQGRCGPTTCKDIVLRTTNAGLLISPDCTQR
jgi:hypothetical protein